ncbi:hypothetical protein HZB02_03400 [Candidatus Woesearchaeota archaeon]|nr:hypothetical protein [Candidatus Woesearchaeota archaeon]
MQHQNNLRLIQLGVLMMIFSVMSIFVLAIGPLASGGGAGGSSYGQDGYGYCYGYGEINNGYGYGYGDGYGYGYGYFCPYVKLNSLQAGQVVKGLISLAWQGLFDHSFSLAIDYRPVSSARVRAADGWINLFFDPAASGDGSYVWNTAAVADGSYDVRIHAEDSFANTAEDIVRVTVDNHIPVTQGGGGGGGGSSGDTIIFSSGGGGSTCIESWSCTWGVCRNGIQRPSQCTDLNACGTFSSRPASRSCNDGEVVYQGTSLPTEVLYERQQQKTVKEEKQSAANGAGANGITGAVIGFLGKSPAIIPLIFIGIVGLTFIIGALYGSMQHPQYEHEQSSSKTEESEQPIEEQHSSKPKNGKRKNGNGTKRH